MISEAHKKRMMDAIDSELGNKYITTDTALLQLDEDFDGTALERCWSIQFTAMNTEKGTSEYFVEFIGPTDYITNLVGSRLTKCAQDVAAMVRAKLP